MERKNVYTTENEHVDVRGAYPVYVCGMMAVKLPGKNRDITLEDARACAAQIEA